MFCENCGKPLKEGQRFCPDCGTPAGEPAAVPRQPAPQQSIPEQPASEQPISEQPIPGQSALQAGAPRQDPDLKTAGAEAAASLKTLFGSLGAAIAASAPVQKFKTIPRKQKLTIGGAAAALVLVLACLPLFGGRGYEKTVDQFIVNGIEKPSAKAVIYLVPEEIFEEEDLYREEMEEYMEELDRACEKQQKQLKEILGKDWKLTYTITEDEEVDEDDLEEIQDYYADFYDLEVKEAREVKVKLRFKGSKSNESATMRLPLVKIGRSWYIDYVNMGGIRISPSF